MIKLIITQAVFMLICTFSYSQSEPEMIFSMTPMNDTIMDQLVYPIGTTFYVKQLKRAKKPIEKKSSITYFGDLELTIYPADKSKSSIIKKLKNHQLTVVYYGQKKSEPIKNNKKEDSLFEVENRAEALSLSEMPVKITTYPNPAISEINIEWSNVKSKDLSIEIVSLSGSIVRSISVNDNTPFAMDISDIDQGLYILVLKDGSRILSSEKILLNTGN